PRDRPVGARAAGRARPHVEAVVTTGLVVMAYGTPASPDDVEAYYTHIRRGRPPTSEQLRDLADRYAAIGGVSPLARRTRDQAAAIAAALAADEPGRWRVELGNKHAPPFLEDAVAAVVAGDPRPDRVVGLVLARSEERRVGRARRPSWGA